MPVRTKDKKNTALFFWKGYHGTKIKQKGINIGGNIRQIRKMKNIGQTELARMVQLNDVYMTREMLVKIERGIQHITGAQLKGIRDCLNTTYDELLKEVRS